MSQPKRMKMVELEEESWDVMDFPPHIIEEILSYLDDSELLESMLTSRKWQDTIGSSLQFRNRIELTKCVKFTWNFSKRIIRSNRSYEILNLIEGSFLSIDRKWISSKKWKKVTLSDQRIDTIECFTKCLLSLGNSLVQLNLDNVSFNKYVKIDHNCAKIVIPSLKKLTFTGHEFMALKPFMTAQPKLEQLKFDVSFPHFHIKILSEWQIHVITQILMMNTSISSLTLTGQCSISLFQSEEILKMCLKLKKLSLNSERNRIAELIASQGAAIMRIRNFISQQAVNLQFLELQFICNFDLIFSIWNKLINLKTLAAAFHSSFRTHDNYPSNSSLKPLKALSCLIVLNSQEAEEFVETAFAVAPNIETFVVPNFSREVVECAVKSLNKLKTVGCLMEAQKAVKHYKEMKAKGNGIKMNIKFCRMDLNDIDRYSSLPM